MSAVNLDPVKTRLVCVSGSHSVGRHATADVFLTQGFWHLGTLGRFTLRKMEGVHDSRGSDDCFIGVRSHAFFSDTADVPDLWNDVAAGFVDLLDNVSPTSQCMLAVEVRYIGIAVCTDEIRVGALCND